MFATWQVIWMKSAPTTGAGPLLTITVFDRNEIAFVCVCPTSAVKMGTLIKPVLKIYHSCSFSYFCVVSVPVIFLDICIKKVKSQSNLIYLFPMFKNNLQTLMNWLHAEERTKGFITLLILNNKFNAIKCRAALKGCVKSKCFLKPIILSNSHIVFKSWPKTDCFPRQ